MDKGSKKAYRHDVNMLQTNISHREDKKVENYKITVCGVERTLPIIPIDDKMAFASFVVLGDTELISVCAPELAKKIGEVDVVLTAEAQTAGTEGVYRRTKEREVLHEGHSLCSCALYHDRG